MQYKNGSSFSEFLENMRQMCRIKSRMSTKMIADFDRNRIENHSPFDLLKVSLDFNEIMAALERSDNPFKFYISQEKNMIWSLDATSNFSSLRRLQSTSQSALMGYYFMMYSLPGIVSLKQGDEIEYARKSPDYPRMYQWDNLLPHGGFSNASDQTLWWLESFLSGDASRNNLSYEKTLDSKTAMVNPRSFLHFQAAFNLRVKPKLNDDLATMRQDKSVPPKIIIPKAPEPFKNSYNSLSSLYLAKSEIYDINVEHSVLKVRRKIKNGQSQSFYSIRFYRNVLFLVNFSQMNIPLDRLISATGSISVLTGPIHVIFDSCRLFPDYVHLITPNYQAFYELKSNCFVSIEY
jgi:hypothetical protein